MTVSSAQDSKPKDEHTIDEVVQNMEAEMAAAAAAAHGHVHVEDVRPTTPVSENNQTNNHKKKRKTDDKAAAAVGSQGQVEVNSHLIGEEKKAKDGKHDKEKKSKEEKAADKQAKAADKAAKAAAAAAAQTQAHIDKDAAHAAAAAAAVAAAAAAATGMVPMTLDGVPVDDDKKDDEGLTMDALEHHEEIKEPAKKSKDEKKSKEKKMKHDMEQSVVAAADIITPQQPSVVPMPEDVEKPLIPVDQLLEDSPFTTIAPSDVGHALLDTLLETRPEEGVIVPTSEEKPRKLKPKKKGRKDSEDGMDDMDDGKDNSRSGKPRGAYCVNRSQPGLLEADSTFPDFDSFKEKVYAISKEQTSQRPIKARKTTTLVVFACKTPECPFSAGLRKRSDGIFRVIKSCHLQHSDLCKSSSKLPKEKLRKRPRKGDKDDEQDDEHEHEHEHEEHEHEHEHEHEGHEHEAEVEAEGEAQEQEPEQ